MLVREGDLRERRVLEVGCGTGLLAQALAERAGAQVSAVDAEPEMVEVARARVPDVRVAQAESLPFEDASFERAVLRLVVHLVDRGRALAELCRVLAPGGRAAIATFDHSHFDVWWLNRLFPEIAEIDKRRFPEPAALCDELVSAGFGSARVVRLSQRHESTRERALERIRGRHISSFDLLTEEQLAAGTERAERELPEIVEGRLEWAVVIAGV